MDPLDIKTGANSCCHYELSEFRKEENGFISFPHHYYNDYFIDYFDDHNIDVKRAGKGRFKAQLDWETLYRLKHESYSALIWYTPLADNTFKSYFLAYSDSPKAFEYVDNWPVFVKLDTVSPKDTGHSCIFNSAEEVLKVFSQSERVQNTVNQPKLLGFNHAYFVRKVDSSLRDEMRCFVYHGKLTAVSASNKVSNKEDVEYFMKIIAEKLPYQNAVVDIGITDSGLKVIEVNDFGPDSPAGAGNFNWREDYFDLHDSTTVTWR